MLTFSDKKRTEHYRILKKAQEFMRFRSKGLFNGKNSQGDYYPHTDKKGNIYRKKSEVKIYNEQE